MVSNWRLMLYKRCLNSLTEMAAEALTLTSFSELLEYAYNVDIFKG